MIHQSNNFSKPNNDHREHQIMNNKKKKKKKKLDRSSLVPQSLSYGSEVISCLWTVI